MAASRKTMNDYFSAIRNTQTNINEIESTLRAYQNEFTALQGNWRHFPNPLSVPGILIIVGVFTLMYKLNSAYANHVYTQASNKPDVKKLINEYNNKPVLQKLTCGAVWPINDYNEVCERSYVMSLFKCLEIWDYDEDIMICLTLYAECKNYCENRQDTAAFQFILPIILSFVAFAAVYLSVLYNIVGKMQSATRTNSHYSSLSASTKLATDPILAKNAISPSDTTALSSLIVELEKTLQQSQRKYNDLLKQVPEIPLENTYLESLSHTNIQSEMIDGKFTQRGVYASGDKIINEIQHYVRGTNSLEPYGFGLFSGVLNQAKNFLSFKEDLVDKFSRNNGEFAKLRQ